MSYEKLRQFRYMRKNVLKGIDKKIKNKQIKKLKTNNDVYIETYCLENKTFKSKLSNDIKLHSKIMF